MCLARSGQLINKVCIKSGKKRYLNKCQEDREKKRSYSGPPPCHRNSVIRALQTHDYQKLIKKTSLLIGAFPTFLLLHV